MNVPLSQQEQREVQIAFQDATDAPPTHGAIFALSGKVYQYLRASGAGVWRFLCPQGDSKSFGIPYPLTEEIVIVQPAQQLIAILLQAHAFIPQKDSEDLARLFCEMLKGAGWTNPITSEAQQVPGSIVVQSRDSNEEVPAADIRAVIASLADPTIRGLLIECPDGSHLWTDLIGKTVKVVRG